MYDRSDVRPARRQPARRLLQQARRGPPHRDLAPFTPPLLRPPQRPWRRQGATAAYLAEQGNHRCVALDLASCYERIDHKVVLLAIIKQIAPQLELFSDELNEAYARVEYGVYKKIHK